LARISRLEVAYCGDSLEAALLLVGWVTARAGWTPDAIERHDRSASGRATRPAGGPVVLALECDPEVPGCGGVEALAFRAGSDEIELGRGAASSRLRDLFAEALQPLPAFARGYVEAVTAAAAMLPGEAVAPG